MCSSDFIVENGNKILANKVQDKPNGDDMIKDEISQESIDKALELGKSFAKNVTNMIQNDANLGCKNWDRSI